MQCKCGKPATHKAKLPIRTGKRVTIGGPYYWCDECLATERRRTPGVIAIPLDRAEAPSLPPG